MNIDYGRGKTNIDLETGIRYGIIPAHLVPHLWDSVESEYDPSCPSCGSDLDEGWDDDESQQTAIATHCDYEQDGRICPHCGAEIKDGEEYPDEPTQTVLTGEEEGFVDEHGDVWVTKSPYYTHARFCSPCAPGACYLPSPDENGAPAYCLGPERFDSDHPCPYPVWSVKDNSRV